MFPNMCIKTDAPQHLGTICNVIHRTLVPREKITNEARHDSIFYLTALHLTIVQLISEENEKR